ncbi:MULTISPECIES: enoyl-CoA hydratase/isomerase family protein [Allobacillus]|uniref:Ethylmalonyl-CoA decarboxylase n=1 Tax=Allobacillus salarius TaxID=1955272 RepID=A0A556PRR3_9BACI|nr:enoyl-CoA hydratase/isomerase family protein [Allobacillus salarius]TSJ67054.1 enoyl-CoA hydratase/isomerase family protein [Allobacillus salarius]
MEQVLKYERYENGLAVLTINRPNKRNAISKEVVSLFAQYITELENNDNIKLLVITGEGQQAFCSGGDLKDFHGHLKADEAYELLKPMQEVLYRIATLPFPTLAWMNGSARGGGMELASACDFRFASENGNYGFVQGNLGIATGWGGGSLLYRRIHPQQAHYWQIESAIKSVKELEEAGFIQKVIHQEFVPHAEELTMFLSKSVEQLRSWKAQWLRHHSIEQLIFEMDEEVATCSKLWESEAHIEAVNRFFSK